MVEFTYPDGSKLMSECRHQPHCWDSVSEHAHGSEGTADISSYKITGKNEWSAHKRNEPNPYQVEHDDFFRAIREGKEYNEADYGATSTFTAIFGRMATYSGKMLKWDEALAHGLDIMPKQYAWDANPPVMPDKHGKYPVAKPGVTKVMEEPSKG
jgi:hypothetical protein